jgi:hypothetical protein
VCGSLMRQSAKDGRTSCRPLVFKGRRGPLDPSSTRRSRPASRIGGEVEGRDYRQRQIPPCRHTPATSEKQAVADGVRQPQRPRSYSLARRHFLRRPYFSWRYCAIARIRFMAQIEGCASSLESSGWCRRCGPTGPKGRFVLCRRVAGRNRRRQDRRGCGGRPVPSSSPPEVGLVHVDDIA